MLQQIPTTPTARLQWDFKETMTVNELLVLSEQSLAIFAVLQPLQLAQ